MDMPRRLPPHCVEDRDRHGNVRVYLRIKGSPKVRLTGTPWTPEFMGQYDAALRGEPTELVPRDTRGRPGTWRWLCQQYFGSADFTQLSADFQTVRRNILEATFDEPTKPGASFVFGDASIEDMTKKAVRILRDRKVETPEAANNRLKAIRRVFAYGLEMHEDLVLSNPARDVKYIQTLSEGYYTWSIEDVLQYLKRHGPGTMARRALCVLLYTGVRRSDAVKLGRQMVRAGTLRFKVKKRKKGEDVRWIEVPVLPELAHELTLGPQDNLTWLTTKWGKPFAVAGFGNWFKDRCREADLPLCTAHGLRKAGATIAAENGATDAQLMAIFGWTTVKMASEYRKKADQKRLARSAMQLITLHRSEYVEVPLQLPVGLNAK